MSSTAPHYLLFTEAKNNSVDRKLGGYWRFVLERIGTTQRTQESDEEPGIWGERLQLLAAVRGLESLDHPARITMVTRSKYVGRGIRRQLTQWRQNDWHWERFGQMALIKNHDLWQRVDQAMQIHQINCRVWQFDPPHVRTKSHPASDQSELSGATSAQASCVAEQADSKGPIASPPRRDPTTTSSSSFANSRVIAKRDRASRDLDLGLSSNAIESTIESTIEQLSHVSDLLADKIKPMGMGRAYGYAVN